MNVGEATGEPVEITSKTDAVEISVPANYTENSRTITVEAAFTPAPENYDDEPSTDVAWKEVASATQDAALVLIEDFYWAKGNITLKDGKFAGGVRKYSLTDGGVDIAPTTTLLTPGHL